jgi:hypothetical protein
VFLRAGFHEPGAPESITGTLRGIVAQAQKD